MVPKNNLPERKGRGGGDNLKSASILGPQVLMHPPPGALSSRGKALRPSLSCGVSYPPWWRACPWKKN